MADTPTQTTQTSHHVAGEGYSARNKVPTIQGTLDKQRHGAESSGTKEKEELMKKSKESSQPKAQDFEREGEREVLDPVTNQLVIVKDAELEEFKALKVISPEALDPTKPSTAGPATNLPDSQDSGSSTRHPAPTPVQPSNVLLQQFPPPVPSENLSSIISSLNQYALAIDVALAALWFFVAFRAGWMAFFFRTTLIGGLAFGVYAAHGIMGRKIEKELERVRMNMHKQRGEKFSPPTPESVEWLNSFTHVVWPLLNPSLFISLVDMIEDVMQASLPSFVEAVKIDDFTIGKNALRIVSMRALPDQPTEKDYPKEEWIDQGDKSVRAEKQGKKDGESDVDLDQTGDYVNFEVSFAYFAPPGTKKLHNENISLIIAFFLGAYDWLHIPVPIWIAVESICGTVRLRLQMVSEPPFIRNCTFTLMGVPSIEASAIPLVKGLPNVLDLPLISGFVKSSIAAAASAYCAPKSMTMNLAQMIMGDGVKKDTKALGILAITIHYAEGLSAQDDDGGSDPYVVLAYAKFGKPLFSTRVIMHDLNPVWEQTAYLIVSDDEIRSNESLSVQLWDSDELTADDLVGRISVPLTDLVLAPNKVQKRTDKLMGFEDADSLAGTLTWSVAYYDKAKLNRELKTEAGIDHNLPKELQDRPELKVETTAADTAEEADATRCPPDPRYPAGVFSIIVHHINNLERQNLTGASGKDREGQAGQDTDAPEEEGANLPSAYCEIIVNDDILFKTRVKQYSSMPFFEAGTEQFVRDYKNTVVRVVVRDSRLREHDPILGIVNLPLADVLSHSSQVTRLYALQDGVGFGRVSISILFKGVMIDLPKEERGWDTGTVSITAPIRIENRQMDDFDFGKEKLVLSTHAAKQKLPAKAATVDDTGSPIWDIDEAIRLPTYDRYASALFFDYGGGFTLGPLGNKMDATATLWLKDLVDDEPKEIRIPVISSKNLGNLRQIHIDSQAEKTHEYRIIGYLTTTVLLTAGLDEDHETHADRSQAARHEFEAYDRIEGQAKAAEVNATADDDGVVDKKEQAAINKSHQKALESRHRGKMQYKPVRTAKWAKDGLKDRFKKAIGKGGKEETIASEA